MREWFELGEKIGCIEMCHELCYLPSFFIGPHDIEDVHWEIVNYMSGMGLDGSHLNDLKIEDYKKHIITLIKAPNQETKRQLFFLGYYLVKLRMILINELDSYSFEQRTEVYNRIVDIMNWLGLPEDLNSISVETYKEEDFDRIETAICNDPIWSAKGKDFLKTSQNITIDDTNPLPFHQKHPWIYAIIASLIAGFFLMFSFWGKIISFFEGWH